MARWPRRWLPQLAEKAPMMDAEIVKSSIAFERFILDIRVGLAGSIEGTESFHPPAVENYVFAAGEIWLSSPEVDTLLIEEQSGANLITTLSMLKHAIHSMRAIPGLEERISLGGWCQWMRGYWDRLNADGIAQEDEAIYDLLIPALLVEGKSGWIAAYRYGEAQVLEAGTRSTSLTVWSKFDPGALRASIEAASSQLSDAIRARL
jgi:hypothetical protein